MDRLLQPEKFDTLPEDSESTKIFNYWFRTFEGFIATVAANAGENEEINKLALLIHFLTHKTYSFIAEAATYDEAKTALTRAYHKQKRCSSIRQRLLEVDDIDFKTAIKRAEILDRAQHQSVFYSATSTYSTTATKQDSESDSSHPSPPALARLTTRKKRIRQCYFCGDALHTGGRKQSPAKDERCHKCGKVSHFQKVYQSEERKLFAASASTSLSLDKQETLSTDQTPFLRSILAGAPLV